MNRALTPDHGRLVEEGTSLAWPVERPWIRWNLSKKLSVGSNRVENQIAQIGLRSAVYLLACRLWWLLPPVYFFATYFVPHVTLVSKGSFNWISFLIFALLFAPGLLRWIFALRERNTYRSTRGEVP